MSFKVAHRKPSMSCSATVYVIIPRSACLAELTHVFGRLDPLHPSTRTVLRTIRDTIEDIPDHRLHAPPSSVWGEAGMLAGELIHLSAASGGAAHERRLLNDALLYLQARLLGASVLTGNVKDFDYLNRLVPSGRMVLYRQAEPSR